MKKDNVVSMSNFSRRLAIKKSDADIGRLLNGFRRLTRREKETLFTLLDAFLLHKGSIERVGKDL